MDITILSLRGKVVDVENVVMVDADRNDFNVEFVPPDALMGLKKKLDCDCWMLRHA